MTRLSPAGLALGLIGGALFAAPVPKDGSKEDAQRELDKLQGVWVLVGCEKDGREDASDLTRTAFRNEEMTIEGGRAVFTWRTPDGTTSAAGSVKVCPTGRPKGLDLTWESGSEENHGRTQPAAYEVKDIRLRVCWGEVGATDRPRTVSTRPGDGVTVRLYVKKNTK
jgi:uncharacterized protein (TIGR03067 family)